MEGIVGISELDTAIGIGRKLYSKSFKVKINLPPP
jgi:hypothetical protein